MSAQSVEPKREQKGSAMVISVLVTAILSLLGISYLLMADTENRIAENEKLSAQCLYFGEGTIREVKRWFDRPPYVTGYTKNLARPLTTTMDRTHRWIDIDGDGPTAKVQADGTAPKPYYKVGVDNDLDGNDDIFDKPYRSALADMLVGKEAGTDGLGLDEGPDIIINRAANSATATFLDGLRDKIAPNFPASAVGLTARIKRIDIYAPPYLDIAGAWTRYGMATVKVEVEIIRTGFGSAVVASRIVKAVLNETPFPGPFGPLHSCAALNWNGAFNVHWGTSTAVGNADPKSKKLPDSIPRALPPVPQIDLLNFWQSPVDDVAWGNMKTSLEANKIIEDPWFRLVVGGVNKDYNGVLGQQCVSPPSATVPDGSNQFHRMDPLVGCPDFDYYTWKDISKSGGSDVHYLAWDNGTSFRENGTAAARTYESITDAQTGLFFFDTKDGNAPNGTLSNLTPEVSLSGGTYGVRGMVYLNVSNFETKGQAGRAIDMIWPGEPFRDTDQNGTYDPVIDGANGYINLNYNTLVGGNDPHATLRGATADAYGGSVKFNKYGPPILNQTAILWGVFYIAGTLDAQGNATYYGSIVTKGGTANKMTGTPDVWWDPRIKDSWPPPDWDLPRVIITRWQTDL
jgi:hypothetical protein